MHICHGNAQSFITSTIFNRMCMHVRAFKLQWSCACPQYMYAHTCKPKDYTRRANVVHTHVLRTCRGIKDMTHARSRWHVNSTRVQIRKHTLTCTRRTWRESCHASCCYSELSSFFHVIETYHFATAKHSSRVIPHLHRAHSASTCQGTNASAHMVPSWYTKMSGWR